MIETFLSLGVLFCGSCLSVSSVQVGWYNSDWRYRRKVTINHRRVSGADLSNFPVLICLTDADLKGVANGGHVLQPQGEDVLFTGSDGKQNLDYEVEKYNPATGKLKAWVRIPTLSHAADTVLYLYYGNLTCKSQQNAEGVWDANYKMVMHVNKTFDGKKDFIKVAHSEKLNITDEITVEAWSNSKNPKAEALQTIISKWSPLTSFNTFDAYDAGNTSNLDTTGFLGAVFDGRYIYFSPQHDKTTRHGKALRYDTQENFNDPKSWSGYNAENTAGLVTKGFYGNVFDGRYVYYVPRLDGVNFHRRVLRYDTKKDFTNSGSWDAYDAGAQISCQGGAFDGRYVYFVPGFGKKEKSGEVLRYDTKADFKDAKSWDTYDAGNTSGLNTKDFDGAVFDGKYIYFAPLTYSAVLRYDTEKEFTDKSSWEAFDAKPLGLRRCVGSVFDGRYVYLVSYDHHILVRYDARGNFNDNAAWSTFDVKSIPGLKNWGYDGGFFDGRYVYFVPFFWTDKNKKKNFHGEVLRYDTQGDFSNPGSWQTADASGTSGLKTIGYNAGAFDGRYFYFAPWHDGEASNKEGKIVGHGRVLRYDTVGNNGSFSLRYCDYGHNGGLCGAVPGPNFIVNTEKGALNISSNTILTPGWHHIAGIYDGKKIQLFIDGRLAGEKEGKGSIQVNNVDVTIGRILDGLGYFKGTIDEVRISNTARSADWVKTEYDNQNYPSDFCHVGKEEVVEK